MLRKGLAKAKGLVECSPDKDMESLHLRKMLQPKTDNLRCIAMFLAIAIFLAMHRNADAWPFMSD
jgi:hypothetical protein